MRLPLRERYYPLGIPVDIATNSADIFAAVDPAWRRYPEMPCAGPVTLRVTVDDRTSTAPPRPSMNLGEGHMISIVHGGGNFLVCDLSASRAVVRLTRNVAQDVSYVRYHFLDLAVYLMLEARHFCPVHASCISRNGRAIVLCGDSGSGKTSLAYACSKMGWTYVADDATYIIRDRPEPTVAGRPFSIRFRAEARELFPELGAYAPRLRPNGKLDLEIDTSALGLTVALESKACCVVFLNRYEGRRGTDVVPFSRSEAILECSRVICYGDTRIRTAQTRALRDFMELPIMKLNYSELGEAEKALTELAARGV